MGSFFADLATNPFLLTGLLAGIFASVTCGTIGPYVVTRRLVFLSGAIAHIAIGGVGAAIYLRHAWPDVFGALTPLGGGAVAAVLSAPLLAFLRHRVAERLDTVVGALWASGMAVGLLLIKLTPGYHTELMSYLFGNLVYVSRGDVVVLGALAAVVVGMTVLFHRRFLAVCLDPLQARLQGVSVLWTDVVLLSLVALTVISLTRVVGLILVIALLSLPAATAGRLVPRLASMMWLATALNIFLTTVPRIAVYGSSVSPEPAIVLAATAVYLLALAMPARWARRGRGGERVEGGGEGTPRG